MTASTVTRIATNVISITRSFLAFEVNNSLHRTCELKVTYCVLSVKAYLILKFTHVLQDERVRVIELEFLTRGGFAEVTFLLCRCSTCVTQGISTREDILCNRAVMSERDAMGNVPGGKQLCKSSLMPSQDFVSLHRMISHQ